MVKKWYKNSNIIGAFVLGTCTIIAAIITSPYWIKFFEANNNILTSNVKNELINSPMMTNNSKKTDKAQTEQINVISAEASLSKSGALSLDVIYDISENNLDSTLNEIRKKRNLRQLAPLESGKSIEETPAKTYFFIYSVFLSFNENKRYELIKHEGVVDRLRKTNNWFEFHKISENQICIIAFVSKETSSNIARLDGISKKNCSLSAIPWEDSNCLVIVPLNRIISTKFRNITLLDNKTDIYVVDAVIQ